MGGGAAQIIQRNRHGGGYSTHGQSTLGRRTFSLCEAKQDCRHPCMHAGGFIWGYTVPPSHLQALELGCVLLREKVHPRGQHLGRTTTKREKKRWENKGQGKEVDGRGPRSNTKQAAEAASFVNKSHTFARKSSIFHAYTRSGITLSLAQWSRMRKENIYFYMTTSGD